MRAISLYSGAGGMDIGFKKVGFDILWANDFDKAACETYRENMGDHIHHGDIDLLKDSIPDENVDIIFGGPPCQGFSVAGKMDIKDPRSQNIWVFSDIVRKHKPRAFVMENVKALGKLSKWESIRNKFVSDMRDAGYSTSYIVLNSSEFNTPQARERVFFIGFKHNPKIIPDLERMMEPYKSPGQTVREALSILDKAGTGNNTEICKAKITIAPNPVMRKSPYAGMLFNGLGRPTRLDGYSATLPASMGGNKTPIIDEEELYNNSPSWVEEYHSKIRNGENALDFQEAPKRLRRLTVKEAALIQTFPFEYRFCGSQSSIFRQIGNAVPCNLAESVGRMIYNVLTSNDINDSILSQEYQLEMS